jgi:hypothetical protein
MTSSNERPSLDAKLEIEKVLNEIPDEVQAVVSEILRIETKYIHMNLPRGIHDEIVEMVERVVK